MKSFETPPPQTLEIARDRALTKLVAISIALESFKGAPQQILESNNETVKKIKEAVINSCRERTKFDTDNILAGLNDYINSGQGHDLDISQQKEELKRALSDLQRFLK